MIAIERITEQEVEKRFNSLPPVLQEALDSAQNLQVVLRACESHHLLDEEKKLVVQQVTALVLMGYLHPEETGLTLEEALGLNHQAAASVAEALNSRVFSGLRNEIDKVYAPLKPEPEKLEEVKKPAVAPATAVSKLATLPPMPIGGRPAPPKPVAGPPAKPFIDLSSLTAGVKPAPTPTPKPAAPPPATGLPTQAKWKTYGAPPAAETQKPVSPPAAVPKPAVPPAPLPTTPSVPAPVFLKRKLELEPLKPQTSIRIEPTSPFGTTKGAVPQPPRPARLEIGLPTQAGKPPVPPAGQVPKPVRTEMTPPRVVHYTDMRSAIPPMPPKPAPPPIPPTQKKIES